MGCLEAVAGMAIFKMFLFFIVLSSGEVDDDDDDDVFEWSVIVVVVYLLLCILSLYYQFCVTVHDICDLFLNLCLYHTLSYDILPRYHPSLGKISILANIFERG